MTRLLAGLLAATVTLVSGALAREQQGKGLYVVVSDGTGVRGGFQLDDHPLDVPNTTARLMVALMQKDVRLADGQIITGFSFDGWWCPRWCLRTATNRYVEVHAECIRLRCSASGSSTDSRWSPARTGTLTR